MSAIAIADLRDHIIRPALDEIGLSGAAAVELLTGTALQESGGGKYLVQRGGPALGIWQMEPETFEDIFDRFLPQHAPEVLSSVKVLMIPSWRWQDQLIGNLFFACAMARVKYYSSPLPLPLAGDIDAQAAYYVRVYNAGGRATTAEYIANWRAANS